jgi:hypothetical protein
VDWLVTCHIDTVALASTGVSWVPIFELLEQRGLTPYLVNARQAKPDIAVQGFARVNVMRTYPDPLFASNAAGRPLSRFGALSHVVSVSPSRA